MYYPLCFPSKKVYVFIYECGVTNTAPEIFAVSTSNHNKAICRRSKHPRPSFGEGTFLGRHYLAINSFLCQRGNTDSLWHCWDVVLPKITYHLL